MRHLSPAPFRSAVRVIALALVLVASACSDDGGEQADPVDSSDQPASSEEGETTDSSGTSSTSSGSSTSTDTTATTESTTADSTAATSAPGQPLVRVGAVTIERTEPCEERTVAPTFNLTMTSAAGTESVPPQQATQVVVGEVTPTDVTADAMFTVEGEWSLNVQMLEHLTGTTRGTTHTEASRLLERVTIEGQPVDISWRVTQEGDVVEFSEARFVVAPSCVQIQPGTSVILTDGQDSRTAGSTDPAFAEPRDLPLGQPVTVFDGASFPVSSATGWSLKVNVFEHWNGRVYDSAPHTGPGAVTGPVPSSNPGDQAWQIHYDVSVG